MKRTIKTILCVIFALTLAIGTLGIFGCKGKKIRIEICDDTSNAVRAFQLLDAKGVIDLDAEGANNPISANGEGLTFTGSTWTSNDGKIEVTLIAENLLVASMLDYDYACLPCNTAYTGNIGSSKRVAKESDPAQVAGKANVIAARLNDYNTNTAYKAKIDALTNAMLSAGVSNFFETKYLGAMTCDNTTQIDLRTSKDATINGNGAVIKVCASDVPHAEVLKDCVKGILEAQGYTLEVTILDWMIQNDAVANGDYDANYFQHVPYLETYEGSVELFASCKVHYEPLGIYCGKAKVSSWKYDN